VKEMAALLIECHILEDTAFAAGKSQVHPAQAQSLKALAERIAAWKEKHPEGKLAVFGHAFRRYCGSNFELELLRGSATGSTGFKEAKNRPEVFCDWELEGAFSPLIGGKFRFKADVIAFMNFIPDRVKKCAAELIAFWTSRGE
jgi:hypothetical protein